MTDKDYDTACKLIEKQTAKIQEQADEIAELEAKLALVLKDQSDADTYIRKSALSVLPEKEVNGDSYGVPPIENIVDTLVLEINARDRVLEMLDPCKCSFCVMDREPKCVLSCKGGMIAFVRREIEKEGK